MILWESNEIISSGDEKWEVIHRGKIKVLEGSKHMLSYLDIDGEYNLKEHRSNAEYVFMWEIPVENTNRPDSVSQILLYDWRDRPNSTPSIEIDT